MAKIAFFEIEDWEKEYIEKALPGHELKFYNDELSIHDADEISDFDAVAIFIYSEITKEILDKLPNLKLIATMSTGFDHIDINECKKRKIQVCNVPFYGENTVAEHTFALILALSRKIVDSIERTRRGNFETGPEIRGFDLKGKTLGIIGGGHIGMHVARMAKGFEMNILVFDIKRDEELAKQIGFEYAEFDDLLARSDIITLHAPYNPHTHHMINKDNIGKIKKGALLINTARGALIETEALVDALKDGAVSGAGLDVLEEECAVKEEKQLLSKNFPKECNLKTILENHILLEQDNVIITPHNAFNSAEALLRILDTTISNIQKFYEGNTENSISR